MFRLSMSIVLLIFLAGCGETHTTSKRNRVGSSDATLPRTQTSTQTNTSSVSYSEETHIEDLQDSIFSESDTSSWTVIDTVMPSLPTETDTTTTNTKTHTQFDPPTSSTPPPKNTQPNEETFDKPHELYAPPNDIIVALDTSSGMELEREKFEKHFGTFVSTLNSFSADSHIYLLSDIVDIDSSDNLTEIEHPVGGKDALEAQRLLLEGDIDSDLRDHTTRQLVIISNDDAGDFEYIDFISAASNQALGQIHLYGILGTFDSSCPIANIGDYYEGLILSEEYFGKVYEICRTDWDVLFAELAAAIFQSEAEAIYQLSEPADTSRNIVVRVAGKLQSHYNYDTSKKQVRIYGESLPGPTDSVSITYYPKN